MTKEELERDYYADRPTEPYSDDDSPNDWANIAHYAEENLEKAFKQIADLEKENAELKEYNKYLRRKRQGGIQKQYNKVAIIKRQDEQLTKAKEIIKDFLLMAKVEHLKDRYETVDEAEQFLNSEVE